MSLEGINRKESPSRGVGKRKRWLQPGERRSQTRPVGSTGRTRTLMNDDRMKNTELATVSETEWSLRTIQTGRGTVGEE